MKEKHLMSYIKYKENVMKSGRARRLLLLLLRTFGWELPDIGTIQDVGHRFIAFLHGKKLSDLHVSASARSPSRSFPCLIPERRLLVSLSATVVEEMLPRLGYHVASATTAPAFVVVSMSESFQVRSHWHMSGFQSVEPGCQWFRIIHRNGSLAPSVAF